MNNIKATLKPQKELKLLTFLIAAATAIVIFLPFVIYDSGYFLFYGDFNVQQIPFYQHCHEMIRSGNFGWDYTTDLGTNFISSYTFYLLGSPFFLFTLLFPNSFLPYLMAPLFVVKFALAALTAYCFIRRFTARPQSAMLGGILYAFSGFSIYNVFYNHFHEAIVFFPLLLLALEMFMTENKRGYLALAVFICAISNYFFFYGMVVFVIIYWFVRTFSGCYKLSLKKFLLLAFECVLGVLMTAALLLPTAAVILQNSRTEEFITGWTAVLYGKEQIFLNVIQCFFFPPDIPARAVFFPQAKVQWASLGGWLPLFGMTGVICFLQAAKKGHWLRRVLFIMIFMALVPGLNSAFYMFNSAYYARWFYMPILLMCLATAMSCEDLQVNWNSSFRWSLGITLALTAVIGLLPNGYENGKIKGFGLYTDAATNPFKWVYQQFLRLFDKDVTVTEFGMYDIRFWITCLIAITSLILLRLCFPLLKAHGKKFFTAAISLVCVMSVIYSAFFIGCGKSHSYSQSVMINQLIEGDVKLENSDTYRVDVADGVDNTGLYLGLSSINCFHSIVPASVTEFYNFVDIERGVATRPELKSEALRSFLSVKYMLDPQIDSEPSFLNNNGTTKLSGYSFYKSENGYAIYQNDNYVGYGFSLDYYITEEEAVIFGKDDVPDMLLKGVLLNDIQIAKYGAYLKPLSSEYNLGVHNPEKQTFQLDSQTLAEDCKKAASTSATNFKTSNKGFSCTVERDKANLVVFTIPYEEGWSAFVNGKQTTVERVDVGFMAVLVPEGSSTIEFVYKTPLLIEGAMISVVSVAIFLVYILVCFIIKKLRPVSLDIFEEYPESKELLKLHEEYLSSEILEETEEEAEIEAKKDPNEIYGGFTGGFVIDENILDENNLDENNLDENNLDENNGE